MTKRTLIFIIVAWLTLTVFEYYFVPFFILVPLWLLLSSGLFIIFFIELTKLIQERKVLSRLRVYKVVVFFLLFFFTFRDTLINRLIEKIDWMVFYNRRMDIVQQVRKGQLNPNVNWNGWTCQLPYDFPVISNGGNDIGIVRNQQNNTVTVTFFVFRNYMEAPSTELIYTDDKEEMATLNNLALNAPKDNWKLENNWYRTVDR